MQAGPLQPLDRRQGLLERLPATKRFTTDRVNGLLTATRASDWRCDNDMNNERIVRFGITRTLSTKPIGFRPRSCGVEATRPLVLRTRPLRGRIRQL